MSEAVDKLKSLPPLTQQVCGSCVFFDYKNSAYFSICRATSNLAVDSWERQCKRGQLWQPKPPFVPVLVRFKRWLVG